MTRKEILENLYLLGFGKSDGAIGLSEPDFSRIDQALYELDKLDLTEEEIAVLLVKLYFGMSISELEDFVMDKSGLPKSDAWKFVLMEVNKAAQAISSAQNKKRGEKI